MEPEKHAGYSYLTKQKLYHILIKRTIKKETTEKNPEGDNNCIHQWHT
jgi:hypothetical protein